MQASQQNSVTLEIRGLGHVPSFKNKKRICGRNLITRPDVKKWMESAIQSLRSQLRSAFQTTGGVISMAHSQPCLTVLCLHSKEFDDCRQWIADERVYASECDAGQEGCTITIRILP